MNTPEVTVATIASQPPARPVVTPEEVERRGTPWTQQEMVDWVYEYFIVRKSHPGWDASFSECAFLSPQGHRCAAACLVPGREHELADCVQLCDAYTMIRLIGVRHLFPAYDDCENFLSSLQSAHDSAAEYAVDDVAQDCFSEEALVAFRQMFLLKLLDVCALYNLGCPGYYPHRDAETV